MELPKPTNEHQRLSKLEGRWAGAEKLGPSPLAPEGGKARATWDIRQDVDGFFLLADYDETIEGKPGLKGHGVLGWNAKKSAYTLHWFDNLGSPPASPGIGTWKGDSLTFEHDLGDHQGRTIFKLAGEDTLEFLVEMSPDGKQWNAAVDGRYRRLPA